MGQFTFPPDHSVGPGGVVSLAIYLLDWGGRTLDSVNQALRLYCMLGQSCYEESDVMNHIPLDAERADHRISVRLLDLLEADIEALNTGSEVHFDLEQLLELIDYFAYYLQRIHHPREEIIVKDYLVYHHPTAEFMAVIKNLSAQHRDLEQLTAQLQTLIQAVAQDTPVPRERLITELARFLTLQRAHMEFEETHIFPVLEQDRGTADRKRLEAVLATVIDPAFVQGMELACGGLRQRLEDYLPPS